MAMGISGASPVFGPFAAAIVAGLAVASLLTLFVVPSLYLLLEDVKQRLTPRRGPESPGQAWGETATSPAAGAR
jgi:HAE1 family hydrophobic/amphiphilic exporter-1